jgi:hypothetical protein
LGRLRDQTRLRIIRMNLEKLAHENNNGGDRQAAAALYSESEINEYCAALQCDLQSVGGWKTAT